MPRIDVPKDWKRRATPALEELEKAGRRGGVLLVRPYPYRRGEYSREAESAHLLQCPEYHLLRWTNHSSDRHRHRVFAQT
jgi:hypothetical protein